MSRVIATLARRRLPGSAALVAAMAFTSNPAAAFCRSTTVPQAAGICECSATGRPLYWPSGSLAVWASAEGSGRHGISGDQLEETILKAFSAWEAAACADGHPPGLRVEVRGQLSGARKEYDPALKSENVNVIRFVDENWELGYGIVALTTVSVVKSTGRIIDTDTEINGADYGDVSVEDDAIHEVDLLGVLTHEAGHHLGLDHTCEPEATMVTTTAPREYNALRTLAPDDEAGICSIYPSAFAEDVAGGGFTCGVTPAGDTGSGGSLAGVVLGVALALRRRLAGRGRTRRAGVREND